GMPVRPWFFAIVANQCRNVRRTPWFRLTSLIEVAGRPPSHEPEIERVDLERALERLPLADRGALFLHFYLDLPIEEVAATLGVSVIIRQMHPQKVVTSHPSPTPIATPAPSPMSQLLQVPASTPVILFRDPLNDQQLDGVTWDGSARGRVGTNPDVAMGFTQN